MKIFCHGDFLFFLKKQCECVILIHVAAGLCPGETDIGTGFPYTDNYSLKLRKTLLQVFMFYVKIKVKEAVVVTACIAGC